jgi:predicted nucleic-acid-binding protein
LGSSRRYLGVSFWQWSRPVWRCLSHLALAETTWVLASGYERSATEVATAVELLLNHKELTLQEPEVVAAALVIFKKRPAVGFSDCLLLEIARKTGHLPLGTFDRDLGKLDGAQKLSWTLR